MGWKPRQGLGHYQALNKTGLPDFYWYNIPKLGKINQITIKYIYQMATKYTKCQQDRSNGHKIYQNLPLQIPQKFTQIIIICFKICHLAAREQKKRFGLDFVLAARCKTSERKFTMWQRRLVFNLQISAMSAGSRVKL
jgi:hypothetical protein